MYSTPAVSHWLGGRHNTPNKQVSISHSIPHCEVEDSKINDLNENFDSSGTTFDAVFLEGSKLYKN